MAPLRVMGAHDGNLARERERWDGSFKVFAHNVLVVAHGDDAGRVRAHDLPLPFGFVARYHGVRKPARRDRVQALGKRTHRCMTLQPEHALVARNNSDEPIPERAGLIQKGHVPVVEAIEHAEDHNDPCSLFVHVGHIVHERIGG